jgi:hypothetical protein
VGAFFSIFLPTGMGGDAVKMVMLGESTGRIPEAIGVTLVDRAIGLWTLFGLALLALPFTYQLLPTNWGLTIFLVSVMGFIAGILILGTPLLLWIGNKFTLPGQDKINRFYISVSKLGYVALGWAAFISVIFNGLLILFNILIANSVDVYLPPGVFILLTPIISLSLSLPLSIGGLGVREATYLALFQPLGVSPEIAVVMSLFNYGITNILIGLIGGLLFALESLRAIINKKRSSGE